ncbi:MAG: DUF2071 domain-containing protein [Candidatus Obscuribacterales bacterium]|nr:DUF2071 domain-containing protein [Candidatus Obscuribacterales bacterium]
MRLPELRGLIRRRLLVNYRVDPQVLQPLLPAPFKPKLVNGQAVAGICLIRLEQIRPSWLPSTLGLTSENAAHRIAVTWCDKEGREREGVYIPRRDTGSILNHFAGGRIFPGEHHKAVFQVRDDGDNVHLKLRSADKSLSVEVKGKENESMPPGSLFPTVEATSDFFRQGSLGYSETKCQCHLDGVVLQTEDWQIKPFAAEITASSYFSNQHCFPAGSVEFDCALIMRNIEHKWLPASALAVKPGQRLPN